MTGFTRQPARRPVSGYVNVLGEATNTASVSVNTNLTYRKDRYFRAELSVDNTAGPVWLGITNVAVMPVGGGNYVASNVTGHVLWPKTPETFTYDADGNLTSDSLWTNQWNAENRRTVIESRAGVPPAARRREQWTHLPDGRWIERIVSTNNGTAYYPAFTNRYVWDGQVLLAVLDHANNVVLSFLRGLDLSSSQAGAGGVGGVLFIGHFGSAISHHAVAYDGNGNVAALVNATDGTETARYEYGPFGEPLRMTSPMARANPIRFSTQYADDVTGDVKYLFRDYDSSTARWPNRDPFGYSLNEYSNFEASMLVEPELAVNAEGIGGALGTTRCGIDKPVGSPMEVKIYDKTCAKPCVEKHEDTHVQDQKSCCDKARAAYQAQGANKAKVAADWNKYLKDGEDYHECRAYKAGVAHCEGLLESKGCNKCFDDWKKGKKLTKEQEKLWPCCVEIRYYARSQGYQRDEYCKSKSASTEPTCPFK